MNVEVSDCSLKKRESTSSQLAWLGVCRYFLTKASQGSVDGFLSEKDK